MTKSENTKQNAPIAKTDAEWRAQLTDLEFQVTRRSNREMVDWIGLYPPVPYVYGG